MTARTEILRAARALAAESVDGTFSPIEVVELLRRRGSPYPASTIRTHVVAAMCVNSPDNHLVKYPDLERVSRGRYRLVGASSGTASSPDVTTEDDELQPFGIEESDGADPVAQAKPLDLALVSSVLTLLTAQPLTERVASMESALAGREAAELADVVGLSDLSWQTAATAMQVRSALGRINDLIHASVICSVIPRILVPGERITVRPSLAAGNDPSRPYDLETSHRIAEFKVAVWQGRDTTRKRMLVADLVNLAMDERPLLKELYVVGARQAGFLTSSTSTMQWALQRSSQGLRDRFVNRYGSEPISIGSFTTSHGAAVRIIDLLDVLPELRVLDLSIRHPQVQVR